MDCLDSIAFGSWIRTLQASSLPPPPPPEGNPDSAATPVNKVDLMEQAKKRIADLEAEVGLKNVIIVIKGLHAYPQVATLRTIKTKVQKLVQN